MHPMLPPRHPGDDCYAIVSSWWTILPAPPRSSWRLFRPSVRSGIYLLLLFSIVRLETCWMGLKEKKKRFEKRTTTTTTTSPMMMMMERKLTLVPCQCVGIQLSRLQEPHLHGRFATSRIRWLESSLRCSACGSCVDLPLLFSLVYVWYVWRRWEYGCLSGDDGSNGCESGGGVGYDM